MTIVTAERKIDEILTRVKALETSVRDLREHPAVSIPPLPPIVEKPLWECDFTKMPWEYGLHQQEFVEGKRISLVNVGGRNAVRLCTEPGDHLYTAGSTDTVRCDLKLPQEKTDGYEGREQWWSPSTWFPDDFVCPPKIWGVAFDFHTSSNPVGKQSNFHLDFSRWDGEVLRFRGYAEGSVDNKITYEKVIGPIKRNVWYDFVYHVKWTSKADGFFNAWVRVGNEIIARKVLAYKGPTLYANDGVYLKIANYHDAHDKASAIIHGPIAMGKTAAAVYAGVLE